MHQMLSSLGLQSMKAYFMALLLPPVPMLLLALCGVLVMRRWPRSGGWLVAVATVGQLLFATPAVGQFLVRVLLDPPAVLSEAAIDGLWHAPKTSIAVVGAGRPVIAPEYGDATLKPAGIERLRYGLWLAQRTALPVGYGGGTAAGDGPLSREAEVAARLAKREFAQPLHWIEATSVDARDNAAKTLALLAAEGIERIVLVTHEYQMPRALANFERSARPHGIRVLPAPMGLPSAVPLTLHGWIPSPSGFELSWLACHEWVGRLAGA